MKKKVCLVTGATDGIGRATAQGLAVLGATVVLVGRNGSKTEAVVHEIQKQTGNGDVHFLLADLSRMADVRQLADTFKSRFSRLDVLVLNAGVVSQTRKVSPDGFELQFAVNHLSAFLLTNLLLDMLKANVQARVVTVSSLGHANGKIHFDDLQFEKTYDHRAAYYQTKLANVLFAFALARRLKGTGVTSNVLHPGIVRTNLSHDYMGNPILRFFEQLIAVSPEKGAQTTLHLAASPDVQNMTGEYFKNSKIASAAPIARDEMLQDRLWDVSIKLTGQN